MTKILNSLEQVFFVFQQNGQVVQREPEAHLNQTYYICIQVILHVPFWDKWHLSITVRVLSTLNQCITVYELGRVGFQLSNKLFKNKLMVISGWRGGSVCLEVGYSPHIMWASSCNLKT